ncbi:MAG: DUF2851 family protein [Bacteroidales bacterium]|nr:DUF2851 family protein [Bacteroidales bacterium]
METHKKRSFFYRYSTTFRIFAKNSTTSIMEDLMYYVWQQRLFQSIETLDNTKIEVIHPGLRNLDAGPDFFNAKVKIDGMLWAGNVEMHCKSSDWYRHHHQGDPAYENVILHVVMQADAIIRHPNGEPIKTVVMKVPAEVLGRYQAITQNNPYSFSAIHCAARLPQVPSIILHDWQTSLLTQRMLNKVARVKDLTEGQNASWQEAFYVILTRSLGTGVNSDSCERLARSLPYSFIQKHLDNPIQVRALLLGQAGLIPNTDSRLLQEYNFLRAKFQLSPMPSSAWKLARLRPYASPENRLNALAALLCSHPNLLSEVMEANDITSLQKIFTLPRQLGEMTVRSILINAVIPISIAYAQWQGDDLRIEKAIEMLETLPSESNRYMDYWNKVGIPQRNAFDSQALLHLYKEYCETKKCMQCRIGCWLVKHKETNNE